MLFVHMVILFLLSYNDGLKNIWLAWGKVLVVVCLLMLTTLILMGVCWLVARRYKGQAVRNSCRKDTC